MRLDDRFDLWATPSSQQRLASIDFWLNRIEDQTRIVWRNIDEWQRACPPNIKVDVTRRKAILQAFLTLVPDSSIPNPGTPIKLFGPYKIAQNEENGDLSWDAYLKFPPDIAPITEIRKYSRYIWTALDPQSQFAADDCVPFEVHSALLWRAQYSNITNLARRWFGKDDAQFSNEQIIPLTPLLESGRLRTEKINSVGKQVWLGLMAAAWEATKRVTYQWQIHLAQLRKSLGPGADLQRRGLHHDWHRHLHCWEQGQYQPIGIIETYNLNAGTEVYFVVA